MKDVQRYVSPYPNSARPQLSRPATPAIRAENDRLRFEADMKKALEASLEEAKQSESAASDEQEPAASPVDNADDLERAIAASLEEANSVDEARFRLQKNLDQWGYQEYAVPGDNNCQFHAVADQLDQNGDKGWHARSLRERVCEWLREAGDRTMDEDGLGERTTLKDACGVLDWEAYVTEMCLQDETWGDEATLLAVACIFEAEVVVISSVTDDCVRTILPPPHWKVPSRQRIFLGHYHEYHYTSVRLSRAYLDGQ